ncbi:hypothetical protein [Streptosporangium sp. NPDC000396]|uniref:hypothetical protein n=1 Tax=Streptosporangium sp. NPDC000396 TaxID=3366185 RepID=UPI003692B56D
MPKFKSVLAGLAISTALAGGIVGLGAATTTTAANASVAQTAAVGFQTWGGCGCHRRCGWGCGCGRRCCGRGHQRVKVRVVNVNNNILRNVQKQEEKHHDSEWDW